MRRAIKLAKAIIVNNNHKTKAALLLKVANLQVPLKRLLVNSLLMKQL